MNEWMNEWMNQSKWINLFKTGGEIEITHYWNNWMIQAKVN